MKVHEEIERKWVLLTPPSLPLLVEKGARRLEIEQTFLTTSHSSRRVRKTKTSEATIWEETTKLHKLPGVNIETTRSINEEQYHQLLLEKDPQRETIKKTRMVLPFQHEDTILLMEVDFFHNLDLNLLEIEFPSQEWLQTTIIFPTWLGEIKEVTGDPFYSNVNLSLNRRS